MPTGLIPFMLIMKQLPNACSMPRQADNKKQKNIE